MKNPTIKVQAPGRINIIGEHTDYNNGFVLPAAIDKKTTVLIRKNETINTARFTANNVKETLEIDLSNFQPMENGWQNYVMGVVSELQKLGAKFSGFDCEFEGNVPIGSGMSSSAALECSLAFALNELFDLGFDKWQLVKAAQMAEHHFVGIECGIMDQFASVMGKKDQVMLLDCRSLAFEYFPFDLGDYQLLLLNTNVSHALADSAYNTRKRECEQGVATLQTAFPKVESLRDATMEMLATLRSDLSDNVYRRCRHIILENIRVQAATQALLNKDFKQLGDLIYQSHESLQNDYEVSCKELDYLANWTKDKSYVLGSRMMGGGFGGCTINIIHKNKVAAFIDAVSKDYKNQFGITLTPYEVSIENGAALI
jgi:galactokinase